MYDGTVSAANGLPRYSSTRRFSFYGRIITDVSDGESEYKSVTATLQRRYADNYSLYGAVTWSKDKDNDSNERNFSGIQAEDFNNLDNNWGYSNRDQEWKVVLNGVWDTPLVGHRPLRLLPLLPPARRYTATIGTDVNDDGDDRHRPADVNGVHFGRNSDRQPDFYTTSTCGCRRASRSDPATWRCSPSASTARTAPTRRSVANNQIWGTGQTPRATFGVEDTLFATTGPFGPRTIQLGLRFDF